MNMGIEDLIPWRRNKMRPIERRFCWSFQFPFQRSWLSLPAVMGGTAFREPECEVVDAPKEIIMTAKLPGIRREEIRLNVRGRTLYLRAERRSEDERGRRGVKGWEHSACSYFRAFRLPVKVHAEKAKVAVRKGVLRVRLPKSGPIETPARLEE